MDKHENLCHRITEALEYFSPKVISEVHDYYYDETHDHVVIYLKRTANISQFCHLLAATQLFTDNDNMRVMYISE